jgi:hypothetical protein
VVLLRRLEVAIGLEEALTAAADLGLRSRDRSTTIVDRPLLVAQALFDVLQPLRPPLDERDWQEPGLVRVVEMAPEVLDLGAERGAGGFRPASSRSRSARAPRASARARRACSRRAPRCSSTAASG